MNPNNNTGNPIEVFKIPESWKNKSNKIRSTFYALRESNWKFERGDENKFLKNLNPGLSNSST